jgi:hypothetical protein
MSQIDLTPPDPPRSGGHQIRQNQVVNERLDGVAKTLATATVTITGLLAALGISTDAVTVAFNNRPELIWVALISAVLAVALSLFALMQPPEKNGVELALVFFGVLAYTLGLLAVVFAASDAANSAGRPTFTNVKLDRPGKHAVLTLQLRADGVERDELIKVFVKSIKLEDQRQGQSVKYVPIGPDRPIFSGFLRPTASGVVEHDIVTPFDPGDATDITVEAWSSADDEPSCEARRPVGSGCVAVRIPTAPPDTAK